MTALSSETQVPDRRWYPPYDAEQWAARTREEMFASIRACVAHAIGAPASGSIIPYELEASDEVFRRLHECAQSCARALYAIGQDGNHVVVTVLAAAVAAAGPDELHPAVISAIEQWCVDAYDPERQLGPARPQH